MAQTNFAATVANSIAAKRAEEEKKRKEQQAASNEFANSVYSNIVSKRDSGKQNTPGADESAESYVSRLAREYTKIGERKQEKAAEITLLQSEREEAAKRAKASEKLMESRYGISGVPQGGFEVDTGRMLPQISASQRFLNQQEKRKEAEEIAKIAEEAKYSLANGEDRYGLSLPNISTTDDEAALLKQAAEMGLNITPDLLKRAQSDEVLKAAAESGVKYDAMKAAADKNEDQQSGLPGITYPSHFYIKEENAKNEAADKAGASENLTYIAANFGLGAADTVRNISSGLGTALGDLKTGGAYSEGYKAIEDYLRNSGLDLFNNKSLYTVDGNGAVYVASDFDEAFIRDVSKATGVSRGIVKSYLEATNSETILNKLGRNVGGAAKTIGKGAYSIGQQIPGILLTAGGSNAVEAARKTAENVATGLIGASVAGSEINRNAREYGYSPANYINAVAKGAVEGALEKKLGFSDAASYRRIAEAFDDMLKPTASVGKSVANAMVKYISSGLEEGLEEVFNVPLSGIVDLMTVDGNKKLVGNGGIFDFAEMFKSGLSGAAVGLIMGGVAGITGVVESADEGGELAAEAKDIEGIVSNLPDAYKVPLKNAAKMSRNEFDAYAAEAYGAFYEYQEDLKSGTVKFTKPSSEATDDNSVAETANNSAPSAVSSAVANATQKNESVGSSSSPAKTALPFATQVEYAAKNPTTENVSAVIRAAEAEFPGRDPVEATLDRLGDRIDLIRKTENALSDPDLKETMRLKREQFEAVEAYIRNKKSEIAGNMTEANTPSANVSRENISLENEPDEDLDRAAEVESDVSAANEENAAENVNTNAEAAVTADSPVTGSGRQAVYESIGIYGAENAEEAVNEFLRQSRGLKGAVDAVRERVADIVKSGTDASEGEIKIFKEIDAEIRKLAKPIANRATRVLNDSFKKMGIDAKVVVDQSLAFDLSGNKPVTNASYDPKTNTIHVSPYATEFDAIASYVVHEMTHQASAAGDGRIVSDLLKAKKLLEDKGAFKGYTREQIERGYSDQVAGRTEAGKKAFLDEEEAAYFLQSLLENRGGAFDALIREDRGLLQRIIDAIKDFFDRNGRKDRAAQRLIEKLESLANEAVAEAERTERRAKTSEAIVKESAEVSSGVSAETMAKVENGETIEATEEVRLSRELDSQYMDKAEEANESKKLVPYNVMADAREARAEIKKIFDDPGLADSLNLPPDIIGNTYIPNGSYDGTEENTTVCIRSLAADALMDAVAEHLGRPLTVEDTLTVSQEYWQYTDQPECLYCYVAMDRKAYREYLGSYLEQRDAVLENIKAGMDKKEAYGIFLDGRKDTKNMRKRFDEWVDIMQSGREFITSADLASDKTMKDAVSRNSALESQINDARAYAQSASWAKKRIGYTAYNNHILKWDDAKVNRLNSQYGLRLYSFSDFSPAFILENMQMITDASVRGLKMLGYTKDINFAKIFAPSGININISTFAYEQNGEMVQDGMQGADWVEAKALRDRYGNVGITFVAVNDAQVEWAMDQDWIDVVIPFHLVRTGSKVAEHFGWTNYSQMQADVKGEGWKKGGKKSIMPHEHQNSKEAYLAALEKANLKPRFVKWVDHPGYMKLVNETRRSAAETPAVQPKFDVGAAKASIEEMIKRGGYFTPVGKTDENMQEIAGEIADKIRADESADVRESRELDGLNFSYQSLISKPDMKLAEFSVPGEYNGSDMPPRKIVVNVAMENARNKNNPRNTEEEVYVYNADTGRDVMVSEKSIRHGLNRKYANNAIASANIGDLIENAILVNEHEAREGNPEGGIYISAGIMNDKIYVCRIITNDGDVAESFEVMYALNAKKEPDLRYRTDSATTPHDGTDPLARSAAHYRLDSAESVLPVNADLTISIADLLDIVKKYFADVLSDDVLNEMGIERPESPVSGSVRYSRELETESERKIRRQQEKIEYLEKQLRSRTALGWAKAVSPSARRKFAASLAAEIPGVTVEEVSAKLKSVFDVFERPKKGSLDTPEVRFEEARKLAEEAAKELIGNAVQISVDPMWETYYDLRRYLRETPIRSNVSSAEFGGEEDYRNWRQRNKGLLRISDAPNAIGVDMAYQELSAKYPEFFPEDTVNEADQLKLLGKAAEELKQFAGSRTTKINPLEDVQESFAQDLVSRILYGFDSLAETTRAASAELGVTVKEEEMRRVRAESERESAQREDAAYRRGVRKGMDSNDKLVQAEYERNQIEVQNMEREYRAARDNFNREIERQNQRIARLQKRIESRNETARLATERKKALASLNRLYAMLMNPNRSKHIPQNLRAPVAKLLESLGTTRLPNGKTVTMDTMRNIQDAEYGRFEQDSIRAADDMERIIRANKTESGVTDQYLDKLTANIQHLKEIYGDINPEDPDAPMLPPDLMSSRKIDYITQVGKILSMVEKYVKQSDMLFINDKAVEAHEFADGLIAELRSKNEKTQNQVRINLLRKYFDGVGYNFVNADLFFEMMGEHGVELAHRYRRAQNVQAQSEEEYAEYMKRVTKDGYSTHKAGLNGDLIDIGNFEVSRAQLMQLYLTWQRPAGRRHLRKGGAVFTNAIGEESSARKIEHITQQKYDELISHLTEEDKRIADAVGRFLTNQAARWGNEASMAMYGYRMFEDPHYFPMDVSKSVLPGNWDQMDDFWRLEYAGMTKSLKGDASAPLRMTDMFDVADHHIRTMAAYRAYAPVSNDVQRIMDMPGVKEAVSYGMGQKGVKYLDDLIKTIASNKVRNGDMSDAAAPLQFFMNAYKRQAVAFNLSTAAKQPLSLLRAFNEMDSKYIMSANVSGEEYKRALAAMIENSGVAKMKMLGYSDTGFAKSLRQIYDSDYVNESGIIRGTLTRGDGGRRAVKAYDKITDAGMWLAGKMDEVTWVRLWVACEKEISDKYPALKGDERMSKVTERFNDLIGRTQVVDTILDTSPLMRNNAMALLTPFMNEPTKALATILTAAEAVRDKRPYGKQKLKKAVGLVLLNNLVLEPIITTLFSMWRDEEDDTESLADFTEKFFKLYVGVDLKDGTTLTSIATSNVVGGIFGFPIIQIFYDTFSDASQNFSNEKIDTAALSNLVKSTKNLFTNLPKKPEDRAKSNYKLISEFIGAAAAATGIPANTIRRQLSAVYRSIIELTDNYEAQWEYNKMLYNLENSNARAQKYFYDIMAAAYKAGDTEAYRAMQEDLNEIVSDTPSIVSVESVEKAIKKRGGEVEVGSDLWYVDVQSRFYLDNYVKGNKVENFLAATYRIALKAGMAEDDIKTKLLLSMPESSGTFISTEKPDGKYSYKEIEPEDKKGPVFYRIDSVGYEEYIHDVGLLSYKVLTELRSSSNQRAWDSLTPGQQVYAINKVYDYAKSIYKSEYDSGCGGLENWMKDLYKKKAGQAEIASAVIALAKSKDK